MKLFVAAAVVWIGVTAPGFAQQAATPVIELAAGYVADRVTPVQAGGDISAREISPACSGFIADDADLAVQYSAGAEPLIISVNAPSDTTLIVRAPDGQFHCDDDGGANGTNPAIRFDAPSSGLYNIWVGAYRANTVAPARLHLSNTRSQ